MLGAEAIGQDAEQQPAAEPGESGEAVDGDRGQRRDAADHGVAHHVEDRPGMRRAAGEMRQRQRDELRGFERLRDGPLHFRCAGSICGSRCRRLWRLSHQKRGRYQKRQCDNADHQHRRAPVIGRDQPARERGDRQRRNAHAGRHQRNREAAVVFDPGARRRHHRRIETAGRNADQDAERQLELPQAGGLARPDQPGAEQQRA